MSNIEMTHVDSSQISAIGHDASTNTLAIRFKDWKGRASSLYHYANFTAEDFEAFKNAESKGRHFAQHIKHETAKYPYTRINEDLPRAA